MASNAAGRARWQAAQEAHVVATVVLLIRQSELLLSTLRRHAASLSQGAAPAGRASVSVGNFATLPGLETDGMRVKFGSCV